MSEASIINLNSTTPATPDGAATVKWQGDDNTNPRNVSAYVDHATATEQGSIATTGDLGGNGLAPVVTGIQTIPVVIDHVPAQDEVLSFDLNGADPNTGIGGRLILAPGGGGVSLPIAESDVTGLVSDLAAKAPLASPALTGTPTAPTPSSGDNSTKIATTAYVDTAVAAVSGGGSTILTGTTDPWASGTPATVANAQSKVALGLSATTTSNVTAGNLLVVAAGWAAGSAGSPVCTDTLGTSYTLRGIQLHDDGAVLAVFSGIAPSTGGCTVTVSSTSGTSFSQTAISEFSGAQDVIDVSAFSKGNGTTQTATLTTTVSKTLLYAAIEGDHNTDTYSAASGYTRDNFINGSDAIATAWKQHSSSGSISGGFTGGLNFYALGFIAFWPFITGTPGSDGDFYINTTTKKMYGPKTSGSWPTTSILG